MATSGPFSGLLRGVLQQRVESTDSIGACDTKFDMQRTGIGLNEAGLKSRTFRTLFAFGESCECAALA